MKTIFKYATLMLVAATSWAEPNYIEPTPLADKIRIKVQDVIEKPVMEVPLISWGGDMITILANGISTSTQKNSEVAKQGLNLDLVLENNFDKQIENYMAGKSPYLRCTIGMCLQAIDILNQDPRTKPVVIYQLTWSKGGDTLVAKNNIVNISQLKDKNIAIQAYGPHIDFLSSLLQDYNMSMNDVNIKWLPDLAGSPDSPPEALFQNDIDAAFMILPDASRLTNGLIRGTGKRGSVKGAQLIISTYYASKVIADVYVVRSDYFQKNRAEVEKFVQALMLAEKQLITLVEDRKNQKTRDLLSVSADILLGDATATGDMDDLYHDAEIVGREGNIQFLSDKAYEFNLASLSKRKQKALIEMGLINREQDILSADIDYSELDY